VKEKIKEREREKGNEGKKEPTLKSGGFFVQKGRSCL
jgi:hypothetical protein